MAFYLESIHPTRDNLWLLSGGRALSGTKRSIVKIDFGGEHTLSKALAPLEHQFDFVVVDTSPSWDSLTINSLFFCTEVLTPVSLEVLTLNGLAFFAKKFRFHPSFPPFSKTQIRHPYVLGQQSQEIAGNFGPTQKILWRFGIQSR